jgi:hypothetical protein
MLGSIITLGVILDELSCKEYLEEVTKLIGTNFLDKWF